MSGLILEMLNALQQRHVYWFGLKVGLMHYHEWAIYFELIKGNTYKIAGQHGGCDIRLPDFMYRRTSQLFTSGYGWFPLVINSHNTTPNDHWNIIGLFNCLRAQHH